MRNCYLLKIICLPFIGITLFSSVNAQSVFEEKGNGKFDLNYSTVQYKSIYDNDGQSKPVPKASSSIFQFNAVYGFAPKWNVILHAPLMVQNHVAADANFNNTGAHSHSGVGDMEIGIRFGIPEKHHIKSSINFYEGLATGDNKVAYGLNTGYGDFNQRLTFEAIYKKSENFFVQGMVGMNNRNKGFGDEGLGEISIGGRFFKKVWLIGNCGGVQPLENGDKSKLVIQNDNYVRNGLYYGLYSQYAGQWHYSADLNFQIYKPLGMSLGYTGFIKGQYVPHDAVWNVSIFYKLTKNIPDTN